MKERFAWGIVGHVRGSEWVPLTVFAALTTILTAPTGIPDVFGVGEQYSVVALVTTCAVIALGWSYRALADFPRVVGAPLTVFALCAVATWPWSHDALTTRRELTALAANVLLLVSTFALARRQKAATILWLAIVIAQTTATQAIAFAYHLGDGLATRPQGYEPSAWSGYPEIGTLASMSAAILIAYFQHARAWAWVAPLGLLSVTLVQIAFLYSRLGYLATMAAAGTALVLGMATGRWRRFGVVAGVGASLVALLWLSNPTFAHMARGAVGSEAAPAGELASARLQVAPLSMRSVIWQRSLRMIGDHPWGLGVGLGNFRAVYEPNYNPIPNDDGRRGVHAHNSWLQFAAEIGVVGAIAFAGMWAGAIWLAGIAAWRAPSTATQAATAAALLYVLVALLVQNMGDNYFWLSGGARGRLQSLHWMALGFAAALVERRRDGRAADAGTPQQQ